MLSSQYFLKFGARDRSRRERPEAPPLPAPILPKGTSVYRQQWEQSESLAVTGFDVLAVSHAQALVLGMIRLRVSYGANLDAFNCIRNEAIEGSISLVMSALEIETQEEREERQAR